PPRVRALVPLIKGDRMDACIEKLVEVGVDAIVVWPAARSVARLDDARRGARLARYRAIAQAAARQSGRARVPDVTAATRPAAAPAASVAAARADLPAGQRLVLDPASDAPLELALDTGGGGSGGSAADDVTIVSGPEGGLTAGERDQLAGFAPLGLGPRVLRA